MINALPYLILVSLYGGLAILYHQVTEEYKRICIKIICITIFIFFFGFRGFIFYDWSNYYPSFNALPDFRELFTQNILKWTWEPGFTILAVTCKSIYPDYQFLELVCCLINTFLLITFFKKYVNNLPLALMIFLCMRGISLSTDLMRNSISIFLFINALKFISDKKPLQYFAICGFACLFHSSALAYLPMYFILNRRYNKIVLLTIFIVANMIYLLHIPILKDTISLFVDLLAPSTKLWIDAYLTMDVNLESSFSVGYIERLLTGILLFCYMSRLYDIRKNNCIFVNSLLLYLFIFLFLSEFRTISVRCSTLFCYAYWIVWIDLIRCFFYRNNRLLFISFIGIYCILRTYGDSNSAMASYYNVLLQDKTYNERLLNFRQHFNDKK